ncbi:MAG: hypothetical protein AAF429_08685 [Pseudomonadota bacterium]
MALLKDKVSARTVLIVIFVYIFVAVSYVGIVYEEYYYYRDFSQREMLPFFLFPLLWMIVCYFIALRALKPPNSHSISFDRIGAFQSFGVSSGTFQHVFYHSKSLGKKILAKTFKSLEAAGLEPISKEVSITDRDKNLVVKDVREFTLIQFKQTRRLSDPSLIISFESKGAMQSFQWWLFERGVLSANFKFLFVAFSPITIFFWFFTWLRDRENYSNKFHKIYPSSYEVMDLNTHLRWVHDRVFDSLVLELENNGVDTSALREQKAQVMNINISGGKVAMGSVVQGAMNRVIGKSRGAS